MEPGSETGATGADNRPARAVSVVALRARADVPLDAFVSELRAGCGAFAVDLTVIDTSGVPSDAAASDPSVRVVRCDASNANAAAIDAFASAPHDTLVGMDADLSHAPSAVAALARALDEGADFVLATRAPATRRSAPLVGRVADFAQVTLARPFARGKDPLTRFFALPRTTFERGQAAFNPIGDKLGLEFMVKCGCTAVREVPALPPTRAPVHRSSLRGHLLYIQHLRRLFIHKYKTWSHLAQFLVVGLSGTAVNLLVLTALLHAGARDGVAVAGGILVSLVTNFLLNRRFTFSYARQGSMMRQFLGFAAACSLGMLVNYATTLVARPYVGSVQLAAAIGIVAATGFNFLSTRFLIFRGKRASSAAPSSNG